MTVYYFGCWQSAGHGLHHQNGLGVRYVENLSPWQERELDAALCPSVRRGDLGQLVMPRVQKEGQAALHHLRGWTALAFWDRSIDLRPGSNSVFVAEGIHDFDTMKVIARASFPHIWKRFEFEVTQ